jgi:glycosyltransferase involved in cell wall biosynthesis
MRVRMLHTLPGDRRTSSEVYARELSSALRRIGATDVELVHHHPTEPARTLAGRRVGLARVAGYFDHYVHYPWRAGAGRADVHHVIEHGYGFLTLRLPPERAVVTFHDAMVMRMQARELPVAPPSRLPLLANRLRIAGIERAAHVIAVSEQSRHDLLRFTNCDPARVSVIHEGVSPLFRPVAPEGRNNRCDRNVVRVLHVGHCGFYKNIETILRVVAALDNRLEFAVEFVKAGSAFTPDQRALIARLGIADRVRWLGHAPTADLPSVYASADVLLMPSLHEGFGLPVLEAMACGTPVVASNAGALPEVIGDAGLTADPLDVDGLAGAIARVLVDPGLRAELRRRGLARAATFTWERTAEATLDIYRRVHEEAS